MVSELVVVPSGFLLLALAVPLPLAAIAAVGFFVGMGFALGENLYVTAFQRNLPEHALSRISSYDWFGSVALNPIGYALIGPVAAAIGITETLVIAGVLNVLVCVSVVLSRRFERSAQSRWRRPPRRPERPKDAADNSRVGGRHWTRTSDLLHVKQVL